MKRITTIKTFAIALISMVSISVSAQTKVLVFSKTAGFRHGSIPVGKLAIMKLGQENGFAVDTTENATAFNDANLKQYNAVVFLSATGDVLDHVQQAAFERYIQSGGGYMGIHAATDCEYFWPWYGKLSGAYFKSHPKQQNAKLVVHDKSHVSTSHLPDTWERFDEWYNFKKVPDHVKVLISIDEKSYQGGENGDNHPMAWYHEFDGGRAFYTELGHTNESFADPLYLKHILGGIKYAIGNGAKPDYSKAKTQNVPEEDRFTKNVLAGGVFDEPTEMAILPNLDILVTQRKGEVMHYSNATKKITQVAKFDLYSRSGVPGVNAEEGLLGITADPDFAKNNFIYMFYATNDTAANRLSRFVFKDGKLDLKSEVKILDVASTRKICCHTGGSLTFGKGRELFLSTGDNATPFNQANSKYKLDGYGPMDNREGFEQYDARRSSSNTNDLRGKVLRINVNTDGTYTIPQGNLFPVGTAKTRPEIYTMGTRNSYRISVDKKTGYLYWGDVGPDAQEDNPERGSRGYDELNQAKKAGYFGWPLFIGNNYPNRNFDYETGKSGDYYDPKKPLNLSKNNTGLVELPPVSPAFIWYPYAKSNEFPDVGTGGRNAMAGPVYYSDMYPAATRFPSYYDGKLMFYEWMRGWIKMVSMDKDGNYEKMEPFMSTTKFANPIDMEMGPDGRLYVLEYGTGWFSKNKDAALSRIEYNGGNRAPKTKISISKKTGALPFTIKASAEGTVDPDKDAITYTWHFGTTLKSSGNVNSTSFTFTKSGEYNIYVEAKDSKGAVTKSEVLKVYAGNEEPVVTVKNESSNNFYFPGIPVPYSVLINDKEDGSTEKGGIDTKSIFVKVDYLSSPDKAQVMGHQIITAAMEGKNLAATLDCKACHKEAEKSIGPAYTQVAAKYEKDPKAKAYLTNKIIKGGSGVWGEVAMSAHPDLKPTDADMIVDWILGLNKKEEPSLPAKGTITPTAKDMGKGNTMVITATYTDKGGAGLRPQSGYGVLTLKSPMLSVEAASSTKTMTVAEFGGRKLAVIEGASGTMNFDNVNLKNVAAFELGYAMQAVPDHGYIISWYVNDVKGTKLGEVKIGRDVDPKSTSVKVPVQNIPDQPFNLVMKMERVDKAESQFVAVTGIKLLAAQ
ncbi:MAG: PKD domain-containing protein [Chitinophagia bacterium]|nr:PKD domain-containing protein [Chitinophagia bacterium]